MGDIMFYKTYKSLSNNLKTDSRVALLTFMEHKDISNGTIKKKKLITKSNLKNNLVPINDDLKEIILDSFQTGTPYLFKSDDKTILIEPFFQKPRLIVFGGGHIAKPLTEFGHSVGFSIVVVDDRPTFANQNRFPFAEEVICEDFNKAFDCLHINISDFIVIVTRGHKHDGVCLRNSLKYTPGYIGMIGSKRRVKAMLEQLLTEGYDKEKLDKICSPIGLNIGAVTPEEIAISIIAQVISYRKGSISGLSKNKKSNWPEFDKYVIDEASTKSDIPRALITIIGTRGSVPRKAGAKMIVWLDGRTLGTIGGGCSEANILALARDIIRTKGYSIQHIDMMGDVAEDEGMVCGGTMDVLIESID